MSQAAASDTAAARPRSPWIISPAWDLAYIVATPLAIVPVVMWLERAVFTPTQIILFVTSFATLAHHLPGFMRAYGDRELFRRFRWRFLLVPPLALATAIAFLPPPSLAARWNLPYRSLDGLELALLLWGTWHGLMQTFGFMRIYDMKRGADDRWTARLDFWLCVMLFVAGFVLSDARVFGLMNVAWRTGVPIVGREWLVAARYVIGIATGIVLLAYLADIVRQTRARRGIGWIKIALAVSTGGLYWFSGRISTNLVIGIAMFEIFHAVQYYAIVWVYNRRLAERVGERFGLLGFLFREKWSMLGLYLGAIAAYGSIRFFSGAPDDVDTIARHADLIALLTAGFNTSTLLHFYFDGFIWKVSDRQTAANLDVAEGVSLADRFVPGAMHAAKWGALAAALGLLVWAQFRQTSATNEAGQTEDARVFAALARWTPDLPEAQLQTARLAIDADNLDAAVALARRAVAQRPRAHEAHAILGDALLFSHQPDEAAEAFRQAIALAGNRWRYHAKLAESLRDAGRIDEALAAIRDAMERLPDEPGLRDELAAMLVFAVDDAKHRDGAASRQYYEELRGINPRDFRTRFRLGQFAYEHGDFEFAAETFRELAAERPEVLAANLVSVAENAKRRGDAVASRWCYQQLRELDLQDFGPRFQFGLFRYERGDFEFAVDVFRNLAADRPDEPKSRMMLGVALLELDRTDEAEAALRQALALAPNDADVQYNLARLLERTGRADEARKHTEEVHRIESGLRSAQ
ncbi:MAG: tetratricopeptide repeat protein [Pirellulales bacterium]